MQRPGGGESGRPRISSQSLSVSSAARFSAGRLEVPEPMDAMNPTGDQRDVAVTFFFENVAEFLFELDVGRLSKGLTTVIHV